MASPTTRQAQDLLPRPEPAAHDDFDRTPHPDDRPQWPEQPRAPAGAPNILLILSDRPREWCRQTPC